MVCAGRLFRRFEVWILSRRFAGRTHEFRLSRFAFTGANAHDPDSKEMLVAVVEEIEKSLVRAERKLVERGVCR
jgi:hypothetical protein